MSRYTIILVRPKEKPSLNTLKTLDSIHAEISTTILKYGGLAYALTSWSILLLSNGVGEHDHRELFYNIKSLQDALNVQMASVINTNPAHAILVAMRILSNRDYYFQDGFEKPYTIGVFTLKHAPNSQDLLSEMASNLGMLSDISRLILSVGGLPLSVSLHRVVSVLSESGVNYIRELLREVNISVGIGSDYKAVNALSKAEEDLVSSI